MEGATPAVVLANHYRFAGGQHISHAQVQSRMLLWVKTGLGQVTINGLTFALSRDDYLFLPWNHSITYRADEGRPFFVGGIHLIPHYETGKPIDYVAAHDRGSAVFDAPGRGDLPASTGEGILRGTFSAAPALAGLAEYTVSWFQRGIRADEEARMIGKLLLAEIDLATVGRSSDKPIPGELGALLKHIRSNLQSELTVRELAAIIHCSPPTVMRLFVRYLGLPPRQWIIKERLETAARILLTTPSSVSEAGRSAGIKDLYYFSRLFKKVYGLPPTAYRRKYSIFAGR